MGKKEKSKEDLIPITNNSAPDNLFNDINSLIESSRTRVALSVNSEMVMLYWQIGERIRKNIPEMDMGKDFAFIARQKKITIDNEYYYLERYNWATSCCPYSANPNGTK